MPPGRLPGEVYRACPTGKRPRGRPRTCWRDYVSRLAWERLGVPPEELEEVSGERELLRYNDRNLILNEARHHGPVKASDGAMLRFFPDFSPATAKKQSSFSTVRRELKEAGLQTFLQYPATLNIIMKHGETNLMHSPDEARQFLGSIPGPHSPRMDVAQGFDNTE
ncbi:hypothetical protein QTP70_020630 [Hemibagrus guttatus]|uniref:Uncharacterized protein n=1 Tax=Hemibagrus guttatus TaxID=175788 RepID=A0AAE0PSK4_9TELE|nr:hypothetical protein QTP70_020630 [Hemibagrus guttatus]